MSVYIITIFIWLSTFSLRRRIHSLYSHVLQRIMGTNKSPRILVMLFATFASCFQSNASDTGETYRSLLGTQSQDRPPRTNSVTKSAEKSADYMLRLLQMFGPIKGNTLLGFTDIGELICNLREVLSILNIKTRCGLVAFTCRFT